MTVINMALFFERFVKTTMSAFFILHQFLGTVQQTQEIGGGVGAATAQKCVFTRFCSLIKKDILLPIYKRRLSIK